MQPEILHLTTARMILICRNFSASKTSFWIFLMLSISAMTDWNFQEMLPQRLLLPRRARRGLGITGNNIYEWRKYCPDPVGNTLRKSLLGRKQAIGGRRRLQRRCSD